LIFERKNDQAARRAEYLQNIKKQGGQTMHKLSTITYSTKYREAFRTKYLKISRGTYDKVFTQ
jgi:uncharacterized protein YnzC (UPF0291/DUF896 family)